MCSSLLQLNRASTFLSLFGCPAHNFTVSVHSQHVLDCNRQLLHKAQKSHSTAANSRQNIMFVVHLGADEPDISLRGR